jgi:hypothetical protein
LTELGIVEDFAVINNPEGLVLVMDRLIPATEINDTQTGMGQAGDPIQIKAEGIRPAVTEKAYHPPQERIGRGIVKIYYSGNSTHELRLQREKGLGQRA